MQPVIGTGPLPLCVTDASSAICDEDDLTNRSTFLGQSRLGKFASQRIQSVLVSMMRVRRVGMGVSVCLMLVLM